MAGDDNWAAPVSHFEPPFGAPRPQPTLTERAVALLEVIICSDYPTQIALGATFAALGYGPLVGGRLSMSYVVLVSLTDTVLLIALIGLFLSAHGERARDVFLGTSPVAREVAVGVPLSFTALLIGVVVLAGIQQLAPWLHTVERNPLQDLIRTPRDGVLFGIVVIVAGGVREEIQRAFLLRRFERWLGGTRVGVVVASVAFGAGHFVQGADAAIATGVLGAFWGVVYLRRRSIVAPVVSHSGFNLIQLTQFLVLGK